MIKATFGLTKEPFSPSDLTLLSQQGGFSFIIGNPGVGKSVLK